MTDLTEKEKDLLRRITANEDLQPLFFRKVSGLKWFHALAEADFFGAAKNPEPVPAAEPGYVTIPHWPAVDYLVRTAPELNSSEDAEIPKKLIEILITTTNHARSSEYGNYRTWWQFAQILVHIPAQHIPISALDMIQYWLADRYERGLVASELGEKWLPKLLDGGSHELELAERVLRELYLVSFEEKLEQQVRSRTRFLQ